MSQPPEKTPTPSLSFGVAPMMVEVPIFTKADLLDLVAAIDEQQAANVRLRGRVRAVLRRVEAAMARWSLPEKKDAAGSGGPPPGPRRPRLKLVTKNEK
jgi:hypothetical protein